MPQFNLTETERAVLNAACNLFQGIAQSGALKDDQAIRAVAKLSVDTAIRMAVDVERSVRDPEELKSLKGGG